MQLIEFTSSDQRFGSSVRYLRRNSAAISVIFLPFQDVFKAKHENLVRKLQQLDPIEAGKLSRSKNCPTKALGFKAGELCELKGIIFAKLGDMVLSDNWIQVGTQLFRNAHVLLSRFYLELSNYIQ